ncbi:MAG: NADH-quinone oxidoreductase subunit J [Planctomycetota bacterium]
MSPWLSHTAFFITALVAIGSAVLVVTRKNPIYAALFLVVFFGTMALEFLLLEAPFLAFMQLLVYGGAIMVLYLFVIMLINPREGDLPDEGGFQDKGIAAGIAFLTFAMLFVAIQRSEKLQGFAAIPALPAVPVGHGGVAAFGLELFSRHLLVFELTSILILVAIIGAVHLSLRARKNAQITPQSSVAEAAAPPEERVHV